MLIDIFHGMIMALADSVPGVSGGTIAFILGFYDKFKPKFVKRFLNGKELVQNALFEYINEVKSGKFPDQEHSYNG